MQLLDQLRRVEVEGLTLDQAVELAAIGRLVSTEFTLNALPIPDWLKDVNATLSGNIASRQRDARLKRLREIQAERVSLLSRDEKRAALANEEEQLQRQLGIAEPVSTK